MPDSLDDLKKRVEEQFRYVDETALVVLKGHLLIEELLDSIISTFVFHSKHFEAAQLRFAQKVSIARALSLDEHDNEMWEIALRLNSLRNDLAHSLDSPKRAAKTQAVIDLYLRLGADMPDIEKQRDQEEHLMLAFAGSYFLGFLHSFREEARRFRKYVDALDYVANPHRHQ